MCRTQTWHQHAIIKRMLNTMIQCNTHKPKKSNHYITWLVTLKYYDRSTPFSLSKNDIVKSDTLSGSILLLKSNYICHRVRNSSYIMSLYLDFTMLKPWTNKPRHNEAVS